MTEGNGPGTVLTPGGEGKSSRGQRRPLRLDPVGRWAERTGALAQNLTVSLRTSIYRTRHPAFAGRGLKMESMMDGAHVARPPQSLKSAGFRGLVGWRTRPLGRETHPNSTKTEAPALGTFPDLAAHALGRDVHLCPSSRPLTSREP